MATRDLKYSDVTPKAAYLDRRRLLAAVAGLALSPLLPRGASAASLSGAPSKWSTADPPASLEDITSYNNFYEFGAGKGDPAQNAGGLTTEPWSVTIDGLCDRPGVYALDDLVRPARLEERIYRLRCVEGWSMVIPWIGFPLADLLARAEPRPGARYVAFETLERPSEMPGQSSFFRLLDWPYVEGLRIDEAAHPLTILAVGLYGETLPNQNGAPIRLVVPWKYGFKSIKSIVRVSFVADEPRTSWNKQNPQEYGFYSNVNPEVDHPRWSQSSERVVGEGLFAARRPTEPFNGYAEAVAGLYSGMDLAKYY